MSRCRSVLLVDEGRPDGYVKIRCGLQEGHHDPEWSSTTAHNSVEHAATWADFTPGAYRDDPPAKEH